MTKKDVGEFMVEMGSVLMALPFVLAVIGIFLYAISLIEFTALTFLVLGVILYYVVAFFLIAYGQEIRKEEKNKKW